jgi:hypothetical protein
MPPKGHTIYSGMTSVDEYQVWVYKLRILFCLKETQRLDLKKKWLKLLNADFQTHFILLIIVLIFQEIILIQEYFYANF